ncbi:MAG TPA: CDP-archaeol synthase [Polyangia bacterium]|nr:CDP-archaeol synthase [Polyangia bacterium]
MRTIFLFIPILGAPLLHAPVLRFDLVRRLKRPMDGGRTFRGQRLFGDNKTWRGALCMFVGALVATVLLSAVPAYWHRLPQSIQARSPWLLGCVIGLGVVLGELPNSFIKRQLHITPGARRRGMRGLFFAIFDQGDFVPVIWLLLLPLWPIPLGELLLAFATIVAVHLVVNLIGFAIGARKTPI